jgi:hypothetical protein
MELCDGCGFLQIERPVNGYDVWRACCCDPDKPMPGARRVVGSAPAGSKRGPIGVQRPRWCTKERIATAPAGPRNDRGRKKKAATVVTTP